jgi:uncharacterized protein YacL (UPF0231 family)
MKLSFDSKKVIVDELRYVANRVPKEAEITKKVYVYSAAHAVVNRILNIEFQPELVLIHNVLQSTYIQINNTLNNIMTGPERVVTIDAGLFDFLAQSLQDLADVISEDGDITTQLGKIAVAGYATTGNGYYLYQKGILKLIDNK